MFTSHRSRGPGNWAAFASLLLALGLLAPFARADASQAAVDRADAVLKTRATGSNILVFLHLGAKYHDHNYVKTMSVTNRPDDFALVYRFEWEDDGITDVAFLCDSTGSVYEVQVLKTNAILSQPFKLADAAIQVVGNAVINMCGDKLSDKDKATLHQCVEAADSKGILEIYLKCCLP